MMMMSRNMMDLGSVNFEALALKRRSMHFEDWRAFFRSSKVDSRFI